MKLLIKLASVLLSLVFALPLSFAARAANAAGEAPAVSEINVIIKPSDYDSLTTNLEKKEFGVHVSLNGAKKQAASINIRGNSTRYMGLATSVRRIPFELTFSDDKAYSGISNRKVKFLNGYTPYRLIAEYMALDIFSDFGVPTPAHEFAFISFNGVDFGLYVAIEDVNRAFLKKHFDNASSFSAYKGTSDSSKNAEYFNSKWFGQMFQKVKGNNQNIEAFLKALDSGEGYEQYIDLDEWLRFFACLAVIGGDGSLLSEVSNLALYDNDGVFELIPWDLNEAFSGRKSPNGIDRYYVRDDVNNPTPLFELIMSDPQNRERYHAYISEAAQKYLSPERIKTELEKILSAISPYLPRDHSILLNSENVLSELRSDEPDSLLCLSYALNGAYENILAQLEGSENTFFVNSALTELYSGDSIELVKKLEERSPMYDPSLPDKIASAYGSSALAVNAAYFVIPAAAIIAAFLIVVFVKKKKQKT
ncbi:MAG: CotH kinase family protein [Clostridia bacterium]|nr:CotH kinase family protein [Clostridia bacterium]